LARLYPGFKNRSDEENGSDEMLMKELDKDDS